MGSQLNAAGTQGGPGDSVHLATRLLTAAIAVALVDRGWAIAAEPGRSFVLSHDGHTFEPLAALQALLDGKTSMEQWRNECRAIGISGCRLCGDTA